jgi:hypothetical protein
MEDESIKKMAMQVAVIQDQILNKEFVEAQHRVQNLLQLLREETGKRIVKYRGNGIYE